MSRHRFTAEQSARIIEMMGQGKRPSEIAESLGLDRQRVADKVQQLRMYGGPSKPSPQAKMRRCLGPGCGWMFLSDGPGNRLCPRCKPIIANIAHTATGCTFAAGRKPGVRA